MESFVHPKDPFLALFPRGSDRRLWISAAEFPMILKGGDSMKIKKIALLGFALLANMVVGSYAFADDSIGSVADGIVTGSIVDGVVTDGNFSSILSLFFGLCYVIGALFGIKAALQLKDHTDNPMQNKFMKPVFSLVVCASLMSMPSFLEMLQTTFSLGSYGVTGQAGDQLGGLVRLSGDTPTSAKDLSSMFIAFATSIPFLMKLVSFGSICAGAFMILKAILMVPQLEQGRVEGSKIIWLMISGIGLWALLPLLTISLGTMGAGASGDGVVNILTTKYHQSKGSGFDASIAAVLVFVQLLGLIAFIRGVMILKMLGENKDGAMGRALTHIFGGAAALNVAWTIKMLAFTIGATTQICGISVNLCA